MEAYHRVYDYVTCGLTAKKPGSAPCPTLIIEYGTSLLFCFKNHTYIALQHGGMYLVTMDMEFSDMYMTVAYSDNIGRHYNSGFHSGCSVVCAYIARSWCTMEQRCARHTQPACSLANVQDMRLQ